MKIRYSKKMGWLFSKIWIGIYINKW